MGHKSSTLKQLWLRRFRLCIAARAATLNLNINPPVFEKERQRTCCMCANDRSDNPAFPRLNARITPLEGRIGVE